MLVHYPGMLFHHDFRCKLCISSVYSSDGMIHSQSTQIMHDTSVTKLIILSKSSFLSGVFWSSLLCRYLRLIIQHPVLGASSYLQHFLLDQDVGPAEIAHLLFFCSECFFLMFHANFSLSYWIPGSCEGQCSQRNLRQAVFSCWGCQEIQSCSEYCLV